MSISPAVAEPGDRQEQSVADTLMRFFSPAGRAEQYSLLRDLRAAGPLHRTPLGLYLATRYADCAAVLQNVSWSHAAEAGQLHPTVSEQDAASEMPTSFLWMDPPDHTRLRNLVSKAFTPGTVAALRPRMVEVSGQLVDAALEAGEFDFLDAIAYPLPLVIICELLGVPAEAQDKVREWAFALVRGFDPDILVSDEERAARSTAARECMAYFRALINERRARPADDLLSALGAVEDRGDVLTETELLATCVTLIVAGHETTANVVGNGVLALMNHPDQWELLRNRRELMDSAVEEVLRYDPPVAMTTRSATQPFTIGGREFAPGEGVVTLICSANRDELVFTDPDRLDVARYYDRKTAPPRHLSFSLGVHYCLGAPLARLEMATLLSEMLDRVRVAEPVTDTPRYKPNVFLRGLADLPTRFRA
jgi:cytochrome P450